MAQISKSAVHVDVRNIGGIDEASVTLPDSVSILTGRNATNRTSFLQALMAGLGSRQSSLKGDAEEGEVTLELGPAIIAVYGATGVDDDLELFVDRHGKAALAPAVMATISYLQGETTRRGVADDLGVPPVEAIAVTQAIERIIVVVKADDPTLAGMTLDVDVHERAIEQAPYQRTNV